YRLHAGGSWTKLSAQQRLEGMLRCLAGVQANLGPIYAPLIERSRARWEEFLSQELNRRVPLAGDAVQAGPVTGLFSDGWVGRTLSVSIHPQRPVCAIIVRGWVSERLPAGTKLTIVVDDQRRETFVLVEGL